MYMRVLSCTHLSSVHTCYITMIQVARTLHCVFVESCNPKWTKVIPILIILTRSINRVEIYTKFVREVMTYFSATNYASADQGITCFNGRKLRLELAYNFFYPTLIPSIIVYFFLFIY